MRAPSLRTLSLRARLLAGMALVALVLVGVAVVITRTTETYLLAQVDDRLEGAANGPMRAIGVAGRPPEGAAGDVTIQTDPPSERSFSTIYVALVDADGDVTVDQPPGFSSVDPPVAQLDGEEALAKARSGELFTVDSDVPGERYRMSARFDEYTGGVIVVGLPIADVDAAIERLVWVEVVATLIVLAVLSLVTWWVIHLGVRPIKRMTAAASTIAAGDLSHRVPTAAEGTEAGELGVALNSMLSRIETAFDERAASEDRLRRFIADASHELRTPVTTIRGYGELYRLGGLEDQAQLDEAMRRTEQEATRMGNLVGDMLQLARLDQGRELQELPVRWDLLVADAVADARAVQPDREVSVQLEAVTVVGDDERLRQVVANLLGNALVHTGVDTPIELDVRAVTTDQGRRAQLTVTDHGPGMDADALAHAFERFYRADPSRSRHQGGSGLGLAIVDSIITAHHGQVWMASESGTGTTVTVRLPLAADA